MNLTLKRHPSLGEATIGELSIGGLHECYTLEDVVRPAGEKVYGKTAIPAGRYRITLELFARHNALWPMLHDVPNFVGIFIHGGNNANDTEGCILPGTTVAPDGQAVWHSQAAFAVLLFKIKDAIARGEQVWIDVQRAELKQEA